MKTLALLFAIVFFFSYAGYTYSEGCVDDCYTPEPPEKRKPKKVKKPKYRGCYVQKVIKRDPDTGQVTNVYVHKPCPL